MFVSILLVLLVAGAKSSSGSSMWPPPAPLHPVDRSQLPANLRPSSLPRPRDADDEDSDRARNDQPRQMLGDSDARPQRSGIDGHDKDHQMGERSPGAVTHATIDGGVRGGSAEDTSMKTDSSAGETHPTESVIVSRADETTKLSETQQIDERVPVCSVSLSDESGAHESSVCTFEKDFEEPMVIEFTGAGCGDTTVVRAGHKRARINSATSSSDVIKHSHVQQPVTFYGSCFLRLTMIL